MAAADAMIGTDLPLMVGIFIPGATYSCGECLCIMFTAGGQRELLTHGVLDKVRQRVGREYVRPARWVGSEGVTVAPNVLHVLLLVLALACARFTLSELRHRSLTRSRLAAPAGLALACALVFLFFQVGAQRPPWLQAAAMIGGLALGGVRGFTMRLEVDHMYERARLPRARGSFLVALALILAVLLEIGSAFVGPAALPFRLAAPEIVAACAGILTGRACAIILRWRGAPHVHLSRTYASRHDSDSVTD